MARSRAKSPRGQPGPAPIEQAAPGVPDLAALVVAATAREAYVAERRRFEARVSGRPSAYGQAPVDRWDGTEGRSTRSGRDYGPYWPKLAAFAVAAGVDVAALIRARFAYSGGRPPEPPDCATDLALECLRRHLSCTPSRLAGRLEAERAVAAAELRFRSGYVERYGWTPERVVVSVASDPNLSLSPLTRYRLAADHGLTELAAEYLPAAVVQYAAARSAYEAYWAEVVDDAVRAGADGLSAAAARNGGGG